MHFLLQSGYNISEVKYMSRQRMNRPNRTHKQPGNDAEKPISKTYPVIDNDLARDNVENDITAADLQDL